MPPQVQQEEIHEGASYDASSIKIQQQQQEEGEEIIPHPALRGSLIPPTSYTGPVMNFSPGPTSLPLSVEMEMQRRCFADHGNGNDRDPSDTDTESQNRHRPRLSTMALSHRSPEFGDILKESLENLRSVMEIPDNYEILFAHGGGHGQFAAIALNLCHRPTDKATYIVNGTWGERAVGEGKKYCQPIVVSSKKDGKYTTVPTMDLDEYGIDPESKFVYVCSNETVNGIEFQKLPKSSRVPLVVDASSDFSSKPVDWNGSNVGVLFACASKNIGHPGVTIVVVRKDLLGNASPICPGFLDYTTNLASHNLWNTVATFNVHVVGLVMEWIASEGGIRHMEAAAIRKSSKIYDIIDASDGFYSCPINDPTLRSRMNLPFDVFGGDEETTNQFLMGAYERGIVGLRTLTPFGYGAYLRASFYHGVDERYADVLADYMQTFVSEHR